MATITKLDGRTARMTLDTTTKLKNWQEMTQALEGCSKKYHDCSKCCLFKTCRDLYDSACPEV